MLANLWEVTDKDINRYTHALLQAWMHSVPEREGSNSIDDSATPPQENTDSVLPKKKVNKLSKLPLSRNKLSPKVSNKHNNEAQASSASSNQASEDWLANSALASREACKLKYVNGAAPVIYGFPIIRKA